MLQTYKKTYISCITGVKCGKLTYTNTIVLERKRSEERPRWEYIKGGALSKAKYEKDPGVIVNNNLSFENHVNVVS